MKYNKAQQIGRAYLLQRTLEERRAAASAACEEARLAHRELARRYAAEARSACSRDRDPPAAPRRPRLALRSS